MDDMRHLTEATDVENESDSRLPLLLALALSSIIVGGAIDLLMDRPDAWLSFHVIFETTMVAGAVVMATTLWMGWWRAERSLAEIRSTLEAKKAERDEWRQTARTALAGFGEAVDAQFRNWHLTPAEREVALLLLKGYSHKHVASETGRSERTARQHAASVYQKAGLNSRAELAAYFLEDLLLPE
jgi:DNA-binding CsgD family transcriptional regulator